MDGDSLISMMVGRELSQLFPVREQPIGDLVLSVRDLSLDGIFKGVSFDLHAGEILGIAGLMGSGRTNVAEAIFGVTPSTGGEILLDGQPVRISDPHMAIEKGFALLTEDRKLSGLFPCLSVLENMEMAVLPHYVGNGFIQRKPCAPCVRTCARSCGSRPRRWNSASTPCLAATSRKRCWPAG